MAEFELARTTTIDAPASAVYPLIADFRQWQTWSPWEGLDPELKRTYSGAESGTGAVYAWAGNRKAGEGRMEILEATDPGKVLIDLQFLKPFKAQNTTTFEIVEAEGKTTVSWVMRGKLNLFMRIMSPVFNMEKNVGGDFEKGLAELKSQAEAAAA